MEKCRQNRIDCFAYGVRGQCRACSETKFKHGCPFYKTAFQRKLGHHAAIQRLTEIGRTDLIEKYGGTNDREQRAIWEGI